MEIKLKPIGKLHSPYKSIEEIRRVRKESIVGEIELFPEFKKGLKDINDFSYLWILWIFHESKDYSLLVKPRIEKAYKGRELRGVFATRSPSRPNPIALTLVELLERKGNKLKVRGLDVIDNTPVIDLKPYVESDRKEKAKFGWSEKLKNKESDKHNLV
jgi:tRNA-Thr(GGU) m(6)t(6)A37 methyltransferase TsaA